MENRRRNESTSGAILHVNGGRRGNLAAFVINSRYIRGVFMSESTGKTIDQLDPYSELDTAQKTYFKSTAVLPARGTTEQDGSLETLKMPVEEFITQADNATITNTAGVLSVANPVPSPVSGTDQGKVLTVNSSDEIVWENPQGGGGGSSILDGVENWISTYNGETVAEYISDPSNAIDKEDLIVSVKVVNGVYKYQPGIHAGSASFLGPWGS
jgi:hypothetical protein